MRRRTFTALAAALMIGLLVSFAVADEAKPRDASEKPAAPILVDLTLKGEISEDPTPIGIDGTPISDNLKGVIDRIAKARADKDVKGLVVRLRDLKVGWAKTNELRRAIQEFRKSGKKAFAFVEMGSNADYVVATAADEIVMPESGWLMLKGLAAEVMFYKSLFDKLDIQPDMMQIGEYKAAGEPYTRTRMSPAFREELTSILTDSYAMLAELISKRQGIAVEEAKKLIDGGPYTPQAAKAAGLVNRVAYPDQLEAEIARGLGVPTVKLDTKYGHKKDATDLSGLAGFLKMMQALSGETAKKPASDAPKIAIIYAAGMIMPGKSSSGSLVGGSVLGADTVIKHLREAESDKSVKAIVLRVDSPGGSALASDLIWREIVRLKKPIVASMSDVAGSGGYYISVGCDRIFAEPGTITGSIGVIGGKLALGGMFDKLGITVDTVSIGRNGTLLSTIKPFTPSEKEAMKRLMEETYRQFIKKTAEGRKMDETQVEKLAGGRIYTGRQALKNGLIDELGTLEDALASAKELAGLSRDDEVELLVLPKPKGVLESLFEPLEDRDAETRSMPLPLPRAVQEPLGRLEAMTRLLQAEPVLLIAPCEIRIR